MANIGKITQIIGAVLDIKFSNGKIPEINEAIEIDNDEKGNNKPLLTQKQVGRLITRVGVQETAKKLNKAITESVKDDHPKNI